MKRHVLAIVLAGCGEDSGTIDIDDLGPEIALVSCDKMFGCCTDIEVMERYMGITIDGEPITTEEQCIEFTTSLFVGLVVGPYKASIELGRAEYDSAAAAECVDALHDLTCTQYAMPEVSVPASGCRPFIIPKVANDSACTEDYECTSHNCEGASTPIGGPTTEGTCRPIPSAGQPCDDNCVDGHYCGREPQDSMHRCLATKPDGEQCNLSRECISDFCDDGTCATEALTCDGR